MKRKLLTLALAAAMILSMGASVAAGAQDAESPEAETQQSESLEAAEAAAEDVTADGEVSAEEQAESVISGLYIVNYARAAEQVNLNIIAEPDLVATAEQAGTVIYNFREDGTVILYENGTSTEGTFTAEDGRLTIETEGQSASYEYEWIDGLLVIRDGEDSSILYDFILDDMNFITIEDYSALEINKNAVAVSEADVDSYINTVLQGQTTYEQVTEGMTEEGDIVTISYEGLLEGEEEPFEGGSSEGLTLQLGSGALIDNFEEQITGQEIGSTLEVSVTFPEDYANNPDLAGKNAVFTTTIQSKIVPQVPELTNEWIQEFSVRYLPEQLDTVDAFREYSRAYLEEYLLHTAMLNALAAKTTISGYNSAAAQMLISYSAQNLAATASYYGYDAPAYASLLGYESADAYEQAEAISYLNISMIVNKVMVDQGLTYTTEDLDAALEDYLRLSGYIDTYSPEEYKQQAGTAGTWIYTNLEYKYNLAMDALEDRVELVEPVDTDAEAQNAEPVTKS